MEGNEIFVFKPFHVHEIPRDKNWPIARSGHSIVWGRNKLYLMGGYNSEVDAQVYVNGNNEPCWTSELPLFKEIISWDPHNSWKHIPIEILPDQLVSLTLSFYRNTIVV